MRIDKLWIKSFRNLIDFDLDLNEAKPASAIIGRNGSGKSNLFEAIVTIFQTLDLENQPPFAYRIEYICREHRVAISADPERTTRKTQFTIDGKNMAQSTFRARAEELLPQHVFAYYSGGSDRLESLFRDHQQRFAKDLLEGDDRPLRRLFYSRPEHSQFVLLAANAVQDVEFSTFLKERMGILGIESLLITLHQPHWFSGTPNRIQREEGDPRFWYARGVVSDLLAELWSCALAPIQTDDAVYLFMKNETTLIEFAQDNRDSATLFKKLESIQISDLLEETTARVRCSDVDGSVAFRELSEGEKQYLTVLGLIRFTREEESLFLLDEPDTHLNPAWKLDYLSVLAHAAQTGKTSQLLVATHDPILIAGLTKDEVILLVEQKDGSVAARTPVVDPKGMGFAGVLTSDMFEFTSHLDPETLRKLRTLQKLSHMDKRSDNEESQLQDLTEQVGSLNFSGVLRDPTYRLFVKAFVERGGNELADHVSSSDQREKQLALAQAIVEEILSNKGAGENPE